MEKVSWSDIGFTAGESTHLDSFRRNGDALPFAQELATWRQWVVEVERGELLTLDEFESAYSMRDDVDASFRALESSLRGRLYPVLDDLDFRYRDSTVPGSLPVAAPSNSPWWWSRVPIRNAARAFLDEDIDARR
ncbi:hypothetical protein [Kribbella sp. CA-247076]|uniref:hypothetical protein n=1 Tax=Kribbella sp. CA-247076 TaxID=3239941 RepID=UPI003D91A2EA